VIAQETLPLIIKPFPVRIFTALFVLSLSAQLSSLPMMIQFFASIWQATAERAAAETIPSATSPQ